MFLQARRAAALLDLPVSSFYQLVREGRLPPAVSKVGKHQLWRRDDLVASVDPEWVKARQEQAQSSAGHTPAGQRQRQGAILLAPGSRNPHRRYKDTLTGRSPYAEILGSAGERSTVVGYDEAYDDGDGSRYG